MVAVAQEVIDDLKHRADTAETPEELQAVYEDCNKLSGAGPTRGFLRRYCQEIWSSNGWTGSLVEPTMAM